MAEQLENEVRIYARHLVPLTYPSLAASYWRSILHGFTTWDVDNKGKQKPCYTLHCPHDMPADDWNVSNPTNAVWIFWPTTQECNKLLCTHNISRLGNQGMHIFLPYIWSKAETGNRAPKPVSLLLGSTVKLYKQCMMKLCWWDLGIVKMVTCAAFLLFAADSLGRRRCPSDSWKVLNSADISRAISSLDLNRPRNCHVYHRLLCSFLPSSGRSRYPTFRLFCSCLYLFVCCFLSVWMGTLLLVRLSIYLFLLSDIDRTLGSLFLRYQPHDSVPWMWLSLPVCFFVMLFMQLS